jgi:dipeptidyl aminopeptidase/acylaminoacyl peptidase
MDLYQKVSSGAGKDELLLKSSNVKLPTSWSQDGRFIAYYVIDPKTRQDLWVLPLQGDRKPISFLQTEFSEQYPQLSPDGRLIAYQSDESGRNHVYIQPFPATGAKWQVSTAGGTHPKWRRDGKELFYLAPDRKLMAVAVKAGASVEAAAPTPLFETRLQPAGFQYYAGTADGQRFLVPTPIEETAASTPATLVVNWQAGRR